MNSLLLGARLSVATLRPASMGGLGPLLLSRASPGFRAPRRQSSTLGPEVDFAGSSGAAGGGGRGEGNHHADSHGHTGTEVSCLPPSGQAAVREQVGPPGKEGGLPSAGAGPPALRGGSGIKLPNGFPAQAAHRCLFSWGGDAILFHFGTEAPKRRAGAGCPVVESVPGAPHHRPRDVCAAAGWATAEGTILPRFLCKVTLEAGARTPAALGAEAHSRNGAVSGSPKLGPQSFWESETRSSKPSHHRAEVKHKTGMKPRIWEKKKKSGGREGESAQARSEQCCVQKIKNIPQGSPSVF